MAVFGKDIEETFLKLHKARRSIEVAAQMLAERLDEPFEDRDESTRELYKQMRRDLWDHRNYEREKDSVGILLEEFERELEAMAKPIVDRKYRH